MKTTTRPVPLTLEGPPTVVLLATGELDLDTQQAFEDQVLAALSEASVEVDLSALEFLSVSALRSFVVCDNLARAQDRTVHFVRLSPQSARLLRLAGLEHLLPAA